MFPQLVQPQTSSIAICSKRPSLNIRAVPSACAAPCLQNVNGKVGVGQLRLYHRCVQAGALPRLKEHCNFQAVPQLGHMQCCAAPWLQNVNGNVGVGQLRHYHRCVQAGALPKLKEHCNFQPVPELEHMQCSFSLCSALPSKCKW